MRELNEQDVEHMLREHLRGALEGQVGGALARFRREVEAERAKQGRRWTIWVGCGLGAAAAIIAAVLVIQGLGHVSGKPAGRQQELVALGDPEGVDMEQAMGWRTIDDGVVLVGDDQPMRQLRRQVLEYTQWYDADYQATIEVAAPREEIILVKLNKY